MDCSSERGLIEIHDASLSLGHGKMPPLLLTAEEMADEFRTSVRTIRRMDSAGKLPTPIRMGRSVRWVRQTLVEWIAAGCPRREEFEKQRGRKRSSM